MFGLFSNQSDPPKDVNAASNWFTTNFYKSLCSDIPETGKVNVVYSPPRLLTALGMITLAAFDSTGDEILKSMNLEKENLAELRQKVSEALDGFQIGSDKENYTAELTAKVYCSKNLKLNPVFESKLTKIYKTGIEQLDFDNQEEATKTVNGWLVSTTIKEKIDPESLRKDTRLLLVNDIYFKGFWEHQFDASSTKDKDFFVSSQKKVTVKMMNRTDWMDYADLKAINAHAVRLFYRKRRFSMIIILPRDKNNGLAALQKWNFYQNDQSCVIQKLNNRKVKLNLPRFKVDAALNISVNGTLSLKMKPMSSENQAAVGGIPDTKAENQENAYATHIIQKALIEVDEQGANAATTVVDCKRAKSSSSKPPEIIQFLVNRPFYFEVVDHQNQNRVVFSGHCVDPTITK